MYAHNKTVRGQHTHTYVHRYMHTDLSVYAYIHVQALQQIFTPQFLYAINKDNFTFREHLQTDFDTLNVIVTLSFSVITCVKSRYNSNLLTTDAYNMFVLLENIAYYLLQAVHDSRSTLNNT